MRPAPKTPFSWRSDPAVPAFDDGRILLVMDGNCALCSGAARRIARWDHHDQVRIAPVQSPLGQAMLHHFGLNADDPESWLFIENGIARGSLDGMIALFPRLRPVMAPIRVLRLLPFWLQDWLYARIARNRYRIWGRSDLCAMPDTAVRNRLVQ